MIANKFCLFGFWKPIPRQKCYQIDWIRDQTTGDNNEQVRAENHIRSFLLSIYTTMKLNMAVTHPSPGMRSHWPVIPAMRLLWTIMTPLGRPVEPLVYMTTARSDGWGFTISLCTEGDIKKTFQ